MRWNLASLTAIKCLITTNGQTVSCGANDSICTLDCDSNNCVYPIQCPTTSSCESCTITCGQNCEDETIEGNSCDNVTIYSTVEDGLHNTIINGPVNGDLTIVCNEDLKNECNGMDVDASQSNHLHLYCNDDCDCHGSSITCPTTNTVGASCIIDCSGLQFGSDGCRDMTITTLRGIPRDLDYICNANDVCCTHKGDCNRFVLFLFCLMECSV